MCCDIHSECYDWFGKFCVDSDKFGPKCLGTEWSPKAQVDEYHASHALLLRQLLCPWLSKAMAFQMVLQNNKRSIPIYKDFYLGMLQ